MSDFRAAIRALQKSPAFTLVAVITIAVGIGANTTLFSVYDRLVLNPVTLPRPSSLVAIWTNNTQLNFNAPALSWPRYEDIRDHARSFASVGISAFDNFTLTGNGDPEQLNGQRVSATFFPTLGILPARGRNFTADEDTPNGPAVCIISHELWQTRFGGREQIVGENITLNGQPWQVVGIMPPRLTAPFGQVQLFAPRVFEIGGLTAMQIQAGAGYSQPIARLKPGVSLQQAAIELVALDRSYKERFASRLDANNTSQPRPYVAALVGNLEPAFYTLIGAVSFVLLIACANVASLFLGRLTARHKEIAIRQSLGATRAQVVRQFLIESLVFSLVAGALRRARRPLVAVGDSVDDRVAAAAQHDADAQLARARLHGRRHARQRAAHRPRAGAAGVEGAAGGRAERQRARIVRRAGRALSRDADRRRGRAVGRAARRLEPAAPELPQAAADAARLRAVGRRGGVRRRAADALHHAGASRRSSSTR